MTAIMVDLNKKLNNFFFVLSNPISLDFGFLNRGVKRTLNQLQSANSKNCIKNTGGNDGTGNVLHREKNEHGIFLNYKFYFPTIKNYSRFLYRKITLKTINKY